MKTYNTLVNVIDLARADYGEVTSWGAGSDEDDDYQENVFKNYFAPYLKISKTCSESLDYTDCLAEEISPLGSDEKYSSSIIFGEANVVMLADGSVISFRFSGKTGELGAEFTIDTNGAKEPNVLGRDIFYLIGFENGALYTIPYETPDSVNKDNEPKGNCSLTGTNSEDENGMGCADRLLKEGKMDY